MSSAKNGKEESEAGNRKWATADERIWRDFREKLGNIFSRIDAEKLIAESPGEDAPGAIYYLNLKHFLQSFTPPMTSKQEEKLLYLQMIKRLEAAGDIKPKAREIAERSLQREIEQHGFGLFKKE